MLLGSLNPIVRYAFTLSETVFLKTYFSLGENIFLMGEERKTILGEKLDNEGKKPESQSVFILWCMFAVVSFSMVPLFSIRSKLLSILL